MMQRRVLIPVMLCLAAVACYDFIEPDLAAENADAVLQLTAAVAESGSVVIDGLLVPGLDEDGFRRRVLRDTLSVLSLHIRPATVRQNDTREYIFRGALGGDATFRRFIVDPPRIAGIAQQPAVSWPGFRKLGPDTLRITRGDALLLTVESDATPAQPTRPTQQWSVELVGATNRFVLSANGLPPNPLRIPPEFIPAPPDSILNVSLSLIQSAQVRVERYRGVYNYSARVNWTVIIR